MLVFPQWLGSPCGSHGPYVFYKAFRFNLDGKKRLLSLGEFFLVRCQPDEPLCVAELQLLWEEMTNHQLLSSSKLYFLPEDTPQGRSASHGQVMKPTHLFPAVFYCRCNVVTCSSEFDPFLLQSLKGPVCKDLVAFSDVCDCNPLMSPLFFLEKLVSTQFVKNGTCSILQFS